MRAYTYYMNTRITAKWKSPPCRWEGRRPAGSNGIRDARANRFSFYLLCLDFPSISSPPPRFAGPAAIPVLPRVQQHPGDLTGMAQVVQDREHGTHCVHAEREPPDELFVELLLEVLQHQQADRETRQRARYVRDVADGRRVRRRFEGVTAVHGEPDVHASCKTKKKKNERSVRTSE